MLLVVYYDETGTNDSSYIRCLGKLAYHPFLPFQKLPRPTDTNLQDCGHVARDMVISHELIYWVLYY